MPTLPLAAQAGCTPFAGLLGDRFNRKYLISAGTLLWGCFSAGFGLSRTYTQARLPGRPRRTFESRLAASSLRRAPAPRRANALRSAPALPLAGTLVARRECSALGRRQRCPVSSCTRPGPGEPRPGAPASCGPGAQAAAMTALNGLGLALVIPAATSMIADLYDPHQRGRAFGVILTVSAAGAAPRPPRVAGRSVAAGRRRRGRLRA